MSQTFYITNFEFFQIKQSCTVYYVDVYLNIYVLYILLCKSIHGSLHLYSLLCREVFLEVYILYSLLCREVYLRKSTPCTLITYKHTWKSTSCTVYSVKIYLEVYILYSLQGRSIPGSLRPVQFTMQKYKCKSSSCTVTMQKYTWKSTSCTVYYVKVYSWKSTSCKVYDVEVYLKIYVLNSLLCKSIPGSLRPVQFTMQKYKAGSLRPVQFTMQKYKAGSLRPVQFTMQNYT